MKQINEDYLFQNKTFLLKKEKIKNLTISKKDKKFYKKRILNISTKILENDEPENINNDIIFAFNSFIKLLIQDFKMIDKNDIYQDDYKDFNFDFDNYKNDNDIIDINETDNINEIQNNKNNEIKNLNYTKYKNNKNFNLDNFVLIINKEKNKNNEEINSIVIPKKRIANIKNPLLKNKGLSKNNKQS